MPSAQKVLKSLGGLDRVKEDLQYRQTVELTLSERLPEYISTHPNEWVALYREDDIVVLFEKSIDLLLERTDRKKIPRGKLAVRYLDPNLLQR